MLIKRIILPAIEAKLFPGGAKQPAIVIYGPRQAGKTTLVREILAQHPSDAEYVNCDFPGDRAAFSYEQSDHLPNIVRGKKLLVLDEAQRIENIGLVLKILVDECPWVQVIATGSSSFDLSNKINEPLTGRKREFHLLPLSYEECIADKAKWKRKAITEHMLRFGGYPAAINQSDADAHATLKEIAVSYLFKDIFTFQELRKPEIIEKLLQLLAFQIGSEVSYHELAGQLHVDEELVQRYISLLEAAFVIVRLGAYRRNLRTELVKSRKIYFWDVGVRNVLIGNMNSLDQRQDVGALWENFCIVERMKMNDNHQNHFVRSFFWRTYHQQEIDYIEEKNGELHAYECTWNTSKQKKLPSAFMQAYPKSSFVTVSPETVDAFLLPTSSNATNP